MVPKYNLMKVFSIIAILAMVFSNVQPQHVEAQSGDGLKRQVNAESGRVSFITPADGKSLSAARALGQSIRPQDPAMALAARYAPEFGLQSAERSLTAMDSNRSKDGRLTVRFQQNYENVPVMGGELIVNTNDNGDLYSISGEVSPGLSLSTQPSIDAEQARKTALQVVAKWYEKIPEDFVSTEPALWIYDESLLQPSTRPVELTWRLEVTPKDSSIPVRELVLVNAQRGGISLHFNQVDMAWKASANSDVNRQDTPATPTPEVTEEPVTPTPEPTELPISPEPQATESPVTEEASDLQAAPMDIQAGELAGTWYVATTGNDGNDCSTPSTPCATINAALSQAANGSTIRVGAGTYTGSGTQVVLISKGITLLGGWDSNFATQSGYSTIDGQLTRRGIYVNSGTSGLVTIDRFVVTNGYAMNTMSDGGGGIAIQWDSKLALSNSLVYGNMSFSGGGILSYYGDLTIRNSTISNNRSTSQGGGVIFYNYGSSKTLTINNSTISANTAKLSGGGIYIYDSGSGGTGGETIRNTIIALNTSADGPDCLTTGAGINTASHNIVANPAGCTLPGGSNNAVDPRMTVALVGTPGHHALYKDSPAINAGGLDCEATDQRGVPRPQGAACDIGAYEYPATPPNTATSLAILSGNNQRAFPGTAIPLPFSAGLVTSTGDLVELGGVQITLTAPTMGPSLTFADTGNTTSTITTNSSGVASSMTATANYQSGVYEVSATSGGYSPLKFRVRNAMWFVAPGGNDSNSCDTPDLPCATINAVFSKSEFASNDTIKVAAGIFKNGVTIATGSSLSGGWDSSFSNQVGFSTLDGSGISTQEIQGFSTAVSVDRFVIRNGSTGIYNSNASQFTLTNSSVHSNTFGGFVNFGPSVTLNNVILSNNIRSGGEGGGFFTGKASISMNNVTITNNQGYDGGGIGYSPYYGSGTLSIQVANTILAGNTPNDCKAPITSTGHNIFQSTVGCTFTPGSGDMLNVNPQMGAFIPQLGFHPLLSTSPAINTGVGCYGTTDLRGVSRSNGCDIGAYEYQAPGAVQSLFILNGGGQTTWPGSAFKAPLKVIAVDAASNTVPGVSVTFSGPASGAGVIFSSSNTTSATYQTDAGGVATTSSLTANSQLGSYTVSASTPGVGTPVSFNLENLAWFVAPTGADTNSCMTPGLPCATINGVLAKVKDGDKVYVAEGTYRGTGNQVVSVNKSVSISGGWNSTFTSQTGLSMLDGQNLRPSLYIQTGTVEMERFNIQNGKGQDGGGVQNYGSLTLSNSAIAYNYATRGGGIFNAGSLQLINTTITGNRTSNHGGGIYNSGAARINNTTVSNNITVIRGGGIYNAFPQYMGTTPTLELENSILYGNTYTGSDPTYHYGPDCAENITSMGHNLIGSTAGCTVTVRSGDKFNFNPKLGGFLPALGYQPLQNGSPAINSGSSATCAAKDQRGAARSGICDMGAYEYWTPGAAVTLVPLRNDFRVAPSTAANPPLQVVAVDARGTPVSGVTVAFTAPSSGPGGIFSNGQTALSVITDANGTASAGFTSNDKTGPYQIDAFAAALNVHVTLRLTNFALFVRTDGNDSSECTTPAAACATINGALEKAVDGDNILVAGGRYTKTVNDGRGSIVHIYDKNVAIRGGWDAAFSTQDSQTVIDGERTYQGIYSFAPNLKLEKLTILNSMGGVSNQGVVVLDQMSVIYNEEYGVSNYEGTLTLQNSTISQNRGTGLSNGDGNSFVYNSTIANNTVAAYSDGGGIKNNSGNVTITNTIVAGNTATQGRDCYVYNAGLGSALISNGYNIIGDTTDCTVTAKTGDKFNVDPKLLPLLTAGYQPLQQGSPAINAGNPATCLQKDQRGVLRLADAKCDIGAYEYKAGGSAVKLIGVNTILQRTPVNTAFPRNMEVAALDANGSPVGGVSVTFDAPAGGPSGVFAATGTNTTSGVTNANGYLLASTFTANSEAGGYNVTASTSGLSGSVSFPMQNGAWLVSSTTGNDANDCQTIASPCASIKGVLEKKGFNDGDTIWVAAGSYSTANNYYIRKSFTVIGGWNSTFSAPGGATILLNESYSPIGPGQVVFKQVVFQGSNSGFSNNGNLVLENSTVRQSDYGIWNQGEGLLTLKNVTMSENTVTALRNYGDALVVNSTITNNLGMTVGGIQNYGTVTMQGTLLAGNHATTPQSYASVDCQGNFNSLANNIVGTIGSLDNITNNYDCRGNWSYDLVGDDTDPISAAQVLDPVSTQDPATGQWVHALSLGSLAIDFGHEADCPATDQRGVTRPQGTSCDSGAYEYVFNHDSDSMLIRTFDGNNSDLLPGTFVCDQTNPTCSNGDSHARAAHRYAIGTYNMYKNDFGRTSIDNAGMEVLSTVHYDTGYDNAFWNGYMMVYGDKYGYPLADDVVAHELTHGVTQHESNLFYYYQSGAINESFSDMWGEYYDQVGNVTQDDTPAIRWRIGEDIGDLANPAPLPAVGLRDMHNPELFGDPDKMSSTYYYEGENDNGGVHWNSGVNNKAVSLMVDGGSFNTKTVTALGWEKTAAIYYEVNTNLLTSGADYSDLYYALQTACASLIGQKGIVAGDCVAMKEAIDAVEMNAQPAADFNPDAALCTVSTPVITASDDLENGAGSWIFESGTTDPYPRWQLDSQYGPYAQSGQHSLYADDAPQAGSATDARARFASFTVPNNAYLWFAHAYDFETGNINGGSTLYNFDGGVLEYSTNGGSTWADTVSLIEANGYKGKIYTGFGNPLSGRSAFVGTSHGYISTRLNLASLAGKNVIFRWRLGLDGDVFGWGWWVDNIKVYTCGKSATFADVSSSHPYYTDIEILYANGLTGGCSTGPLKFCPDQIMNRGQAAVFILRANFGASYVPPVPTHVFKDDWSKGTWAEGWAEGMRNEGISAGCLANPLKYCPWDQIPREQAVIFALRMKYGTLYTPPPATGTLFADMTNPSYYATSWAEQAYKDGIIPNCGMSGGKPNFCPKALVSRGLAAYMIVRAKNLTMP